MSDFPQVSRVLKTFFNTEDGLSEDVAIRMYQRANASSANREAYEAELIEAFANGQVSWKNLLLNDDFEVFDAASEDEAREYARKILWVPIFES
jgi:hypothetical protein